jgi:hypothetical protein
MEICRCLNDVITEVEKRTNLIIRARTSNGNLVLIDLYKLKNNPRLEGAEVFKMLFEICDANSFGKFPMRKDEEGCITIIRDLGINSKEWYIFTIFLDTGSVPGYDDYKLGKEYKYYVVSANIQSLREICCKFGGVPSFDVFRENFYNEEREEKAKTIASTPEKDINGKYQWRTVKSAIFVRQHPDSDFGWSFASTVVIKEGNSSVSYHNYRRDWNWNKEEPYYTSDGSNVFD